MEYHECPQCKKLFAKNDNTSEHLKLCNEIAMKNAIDKKDTIAILHMWGKLKPFKTVLINKEDKTIQLNNKYDMDYNPLKKVYLLKSIKVKPMIPQNNKSNPDFIKYMNELMKTAQNTNNFSKLIDCGLMYYAITELPDKSGKNRLIIKIGHTENLCERIKSLRNEYKCMFTIISFVKVKTKTVEVKFHNLLHKLYPELCYTIEINGKRKNELYIHDQCLLDDFLALGIKSSDVN